MTENACRHFLGLYPDDRPACAVGRNVRAWALRCNGNSNFGIGLRLPCTKRRDGSEKPLFDCPELDRKTDEEIEVARAEMSKRMDRLVKGLGAINEIRDRMIEGKISTAKETCPWCGAVKALAVSCAIYQNNHIHCKCESCGEGFIE